MAPAPGLVLFEPHGDPVRIAPRGPLGPWAMGPLGRLLESVERERPVLLDLSGASMASPSEVATVLWADDLAADLGLPLEVLAGDGIGAELLDFLGLRAPVYSPVSAPPSPGERSHARAPRPRRSASAR